MAISERPALRIDGKPAGSRARASATPSSRGYAGLREDAEMVGTSVAYSDGAQRGTQRRTPTADGQLKNEILALLAVVRRRFAVIIVAAAAGAILFGIYAFTSPNIYKATAQLSLDPRSLAVLDVGIERVRRSEAPISDSARVESLIQIMYSDPLAKTVAKELDLQNDSEFNGSRMSIVGSLLASVFGRSAPLSEEERFMIAWQSLQGNLTAERAGTTFVVYLGVQSQDPEKAARLANAYTQAFIKDQLNTNFETIKAAAEWMRSRLTELSAQVIKAEGAVVEYKSKNGIATADGKSIADKVLSDLSEKVQEAASLAAGAKAKLERIQTVNNSSELDLSVTDALTNDVIVNLRKQYLDNRGRANELASRYGENHSAVQKMRREALGIAQSIRSELKRIEETYRSEFEIASAREAALRESMAEQFKKTLVVGESSIYLQELEGAATNARTVYQDMLKRYTETVQKQSFPVPEARVIGVATPPTEKFKPKRMLILFLGALFGGVAGVGAAGMLELFDSRIRTRKDAESVAGADCLGMFPHVTGPRARSGLTFAKTRSPTPEVGPAWDYVVQEPFSVGAEAIRSVKLAADHAGHEHRCRVIGVTSSLPSEGKSSIAINLAHLIGDSGASVLIVDADLRHPALSKRLYPNAKGGLADLLTSGLALETLVESEPALKLDFLPAISGQRVSHSHEILGSSAMADFLDEALETYDYVVLDLPPMLPVVDVRSVARFVDGFLFVIAWGETPRDAVIEALGQSPMVSEKLLGTVLNKVRIEQMERYGSYSKHYYSSNYHSG
jgi:succinoglycan biosynthesis transport protein ExoP